MPRARPAAAMAVRVLRRPAAVAMAPACGARSFLLASGDVSSSYGTDFGSSLYFPDNNAVIKVLVDFKREYM